MGALRNLIRDHRQLAALLVALALCMKALMPAGFMVQAEARVLTVQVCADTQGAQITRQIVIPQKGESHSASAKSDACAYSALAMASLAGADAELLALALAFILALGFLAVTPQRITRAQFLRPPLRGPPASV